MLKVIAVIILAGALTACGSAPQKPTVVSNTAVIYPSLPDIDKPLAPILRPIKFDYPRDNTKPKEVKDTPECVQQPPIANFERVCMQYPILKNSNLYIGMDEQSFKNYFANTEIVNGYGRSLNSRLDEVNAERAKWRESNQQKESVDKSTVK